MGWETSGRKWDDGTFVQNYAEWADPSTPGKLMGFTCNVKFNQDVSAASENDVTIVNTYGSEDASLTNAAAGEGTWDSYGSLMLGDLQLFNADTTATRGDTYKSSYKSKNAMQACGAGAGLWMDGEDNSTYWDLKELGSVKIKSGFRVWEKESDFFPFAQGDAPEVTY